MNAEHNKPCPDCGKIHQPRKPYPVKPNGISFVARTPNAKFKGYSEMIITNDNWLAILCTDGQWWPFRHTSKKDREIAATCFKTMEEMELFNLNLMLGA